MRYEIEKALFSAFWGKKEMAPNMLPGEAVFSGALVKHCDRSYDDTRKCDSKIFISQQELVSEKQQIW